MLKLILIYILSIQLLIITIGSIIVLQGVLNNCSKMLRLTFVIFPIGASLGFLDIMYVSSIHVSAFILNTAIMLILYWMWNQKTMIFDLEQVLRNKELNKPYSFIFDMKAILSCFAIWMLKTINPNEEERCVVCEQILP